MGSGCGAFISFGLWVKTGQGNSTHPIPAHPNPAQRNLAQRNPARPMFPDCVGSASISGVDQSIHEKAVVDGVLFSCVTKNAQRSCNTCENNQTKKLVTGARNTENIIS